MKKYLIIAEKPDMGRKIAQALLKGGGTDKKRYIEGENCFITWAIGHLLQLAPPEHYDEVYQDWSRLPIIPDRFILIEDPKTQHQLKVIKGLAGKTSILINATDAGREGQLIFEYIYRYLQLKHPVMRLWTSSVTENALKRAFKQMKDNKTYYHLYLSAKSRAEADWLVGINGSRACSSKFNQLITVGRVQTPTLSLVYDRTKEIENHHKKIFYEVVVTLNQNGVEYEAKWQGNKIENKENADAIMMKVLNKKGQVTKVDRNTVRESPPKLYDLSLLQQEANKELGFSVSKTLKIAQSLYEKHEVITYPRTGNNYVTKDEIDYMHEVFNLLNQRLNPPFYMESRPEIVSAHNKRICQDISEEDHHAILPTEKKPTGLNEEEKALYFMIVKRFMSQFFPPAQYEETVIETIIDGEVFLTKTKQLVSLGWKTVYGEILSNTPDLLANITTNESVCTAAKVVEKETQPPKPYTEGTLIAAMERAGKNLEGELKDVMKERGLGTPATRAAIIDRLKEVGYIENKEKQLVITDKGKQVIDMLRSIGLEVLTSAEWTGEWERRLNLIAQGKENHAAFMQEIISFVQHTVQQVQQANPNAIVSNSYLCPNCKEPLVERPLSFHCSNCAFVLWKNAFGKKLTDGALNALLIQHETEYMKFKSKNKKEYEAKVRIKNLQTGELELIFKNQIEKSVFCKCPKCNNGEVLDKGSLYGCSKYPICNFHLPKKLLKRELSGEEIKRLLEQKETGELDGFVSKNGKTFRANLKLNDDWKLAFEFENK